MDPIMIGLLGGTLLGALKGNAQQNQADRDRQVASVTARFSPWTNMRPEIPKAPDQMGNMMQGAMSGLLMGQAWGKAGGLGDTMTPTTDQFNLYQHSINPQYGPFIK